MSKLISLSLLLLLIPLVVMIELTKTCTSQPTTNNLKLGFRCNNNTSSSSRKTCTSLIDYKLPNTTTLSSLLNRFQIKNLRTLLSANNLPLTTSHNQSYPSSSILKIPFICSCTNGVGISHGRPVYTVVPEDGLFHIAADVFSNLVTYEQIQQVNNISDSNLITVGQKLWIPLPCSCDEVDGDDVVHYGHLVAAGSTVSGIAQQFNTTETTLLDLNGMTNAADLKADSILDVPIKVCKSSVRNDSLDYPLLVPNGTYTITANNCVKCQCNAAAAAANPAWILECEPSGIMLPNMKTCPSMQCVGTSFDLGNTTSDSTCGQSRCAYLGYTNATIFTNVTQDSTCPDGNNSSSGNGLSGRLRWSFLVGASVVFALHLLRWPSF